MYKGDENVLLQTLKGREDEKQDQEIFEDALIHVMHIKFRPLRLFQLLAEI